MSIPTQMSLVGFIASAPELHFTKAGDECCRMRVGIEQWRKEVDGSFTKLDPTFHDMVAFESTARETYARFRKGDSFVASGYVHEYEVDGREGSVIKEEFVARLGGDEFAQSRMRSGSRRCGELHSLARNDDRVQQGPHAFE